MSELTLRRFLVVANAIASSLGPWRGASPSWFIRASVLCRPVSAAWTMPGGRNILPPDVVCFGRFVTGGRCALTSFLCHPGRPDVIAMWAEGRPPDRFCQQAKRLTRSWVCSYWDAFVGGGCIRRWPGHPHEDTAVNMTDGRSLALALGKTPALISPTVPI